MVLTMTMTMTTTTTTTLTLTIIIIITKINNYEEKILLSLVSTIMMNQFLNILRHLLDYTFPNDRSSRSFSSFPFKLGSWSRWCHHLMDLILAGIDCNLIHHMT